MVMQVAKPLVPIINIEVQRAAPQDPVGEPERGGRPSDRSVGWADMPFWEELASDG